MLLMRNRLAQVLWLVVLAGGCASSHGMVGEDAGAAAPDAFFVLDAGFAGTCEADDARRELCPDAFCRAAPRWYWNGDDCFPIECGACVGADCDVRGAGSEAECLAAHASCESVQCRATGGEWHWWGEECGHFVCGRAPARDCLVGGPFCDCGPWRSFGPSGCFDDMCPTEEPVTRETLCTNAGGTWSGICCDTVCGEYCPLACAEMACDCGPGRVFDEARGCVESVRCYERAAGESCDGQTRCEAGTICCDGCEGPGCTGAQACRAPVCDGDPNTDACGADLAP